VNPRLGSTSAQLVTVFGVPATEGVPVLTGVGVLPVPGVDEDSVEEIAPSSRKIITGFPHQ